MRKKIIPLILLLFAQCLNDNPELSKRERSFAITELNKSRNNLLSAIEGLSDMQLNFKSNEDSWSISECTEHLTIFGNEVFEILNESLELPANPERRKDVKFSDEELIVFVQDRTHKAKTEEGFEPNNLYANHTTIVNTYKKQLDKHIRYLETTKDDLRNHYVNFGTIDTYQIFLYMAAHTNRHIEQIKEIKNNTNFPKN
jgi:hypothetical protein